MDSVLPAPLSPVDFQKIPGPGCREGLGTSWLTWSSSWPRRCRSPGGKLWCRPLQPQQTQRVKHTESLSAQNFSQSLSSPSTPPTDIKNAYLFQTQSHFLTGLQAFHVNDVCSHIYQTWLQERILSHLAFPDVTAVIGRVAIISWIKTLLIGETTPTNNRDLCL